MRTFFEVRYIPPEVRYIPPPGILDVMSARYHPDVRYIPPEVRYMHLTSALTLTDSGPCPRNYYFALFKPTTVSRIEPQAPDQVVPWIVPYCHGLSRNAISLNENIVSRIAQDFVPERP